MSAKQMVGAYRQFVYADESIQHLPEIALLAGSILISWLLPAQPLRPAFGIVSQTVLRAASTV